MKKKRHHSDDSIISDFFDDSSDVAGASDNNNDNNVETVWRPVRNVVNTTTNRRTKRIVHPTHVKNVRKNIVRVENYYPVTESNVDQTIIKEYNCGSDLNNPRCRPVKKKSKCDD